MFRIFSVMFATFVMAALGVAGLDAGVARADGNRAVVDDRRALADHFFHVEWTAGPGAPGRARITGYVYNDYGDSAINVALRIHEIDAGGRDVASVVAPLGDTIPGRGRAYFDVGVPDSHGYRVDVTSFDFVELPG
jgi:hypothetical protein